MKKYGLVWHDPFTVHEQRKHEASLSFAFYESEPDKQVQPFVTTVSEALGKMLPKYLYSIAVSGSRVVKADSYGKRNMGEQAVPNDGPAPESKSIEEPEINESLFRNMDELELSARSSKALKTAEIRTVADLVQKTKIEMLEEIKGFGRVSFNEVEMILGEMGLHFGMVFDPEELERLHTKHESSFK